MPQPVELAKTYSYKAYGLNIESEIKIPELNPGNDVTPDVKISIGSVPKSLSNIKSKGVLFQAAPDELIFFRKNVANYYIKNGKEIVVEPYDGVDLNEVRLLLLSSSIGALLHQRGYLVLHGGSMLCNNVCIAFLGKSGTGKSTLVAALTKRGYPVVTDDICPVCFNNNNSRPFVQPESRFIKIWEDTIEKIGEHKSNLFSFKKNINKFHLLSAHNSQPAPLQHIYILTKSNTRKIELNPLLSYDKISTLINYTYRKGFLSGLNKKSGHFKLCAKVAENVLITEVVRPRYPFSLNELVDTLEKDFIR